MLPFEGTFDEETIWAIEASLAPRREKPLWPARHDGRHTPTLRAPQRELATGLSGGLAQ